MSNPSAGCLRRQARSKPAQNGRVGTLLTDEIEYSLPFGSIGQLWDEAVHRQLKQTFALRQERLPKILDGAVRQMA